MDEMMLMLISADLHPNCAKYGYKGCARRDFTVRLLSDGRTTLD